MIEQFKKLEQPIEITKPLEKKLTLQEETNLEKFFKAIISCDTKTVKDMLAKEPDLINAVYDVDKLFPVDVFHSKENGLHFNEPSSAEEREEEKNHTPIMFVIDELLDIDNELEDLEDDASDGEIDEEEYKKKSKEKYVQAMCFINLLEFLFKQPNLIITLHTKEHATNLFNSLMSRDPSHYEPEELKLLNILLETKLDLLIPDKVYFGGLWFMEQEHNPESFKLLKRLLETKPNLIKKHALELFNQLMYKKPADYVQEDFKLLKILLETKPSPINVNSYIIKYTDQEGKSYETHRSYIHEIFFPDPGICDDECLFSAPRQKLMKLMLAHPSFDATKSAVPPTIYLINYFTPPAPGLWPTFFEKVIQRQELGLMPTIYNTFKDQAWFKKLPYFAIFKALGEISHNHISAETAKAFLKIDQNNPPKIFTDKNLELLQKAYAYAKKNNLKKLGNFIRSFATAAATRFENMPPEESALIARFVGEGASLLTPKEEEKK